MKKIFFFLFLLISFAMFAQKLRANNTVIKIPEGDYDITVNNDTIINCHFDTTAQGYYKDSVHCYSVLIAKTCYDTATTQTPIYRSDTSWTYTTKNCRKVKTGGFWFWSTYKNVCDTVKTISSIKQTITGYTTSTKITPRDCSYSLPVCDTLKNYFFIPPVVFKHCDTTVTSPVLFGIKAQGKVDSQLIAHKAIAAKWNRTGTILPGDAKKDNSIMQFLEAGENVFINISCNNPQNNPQPWFKDLVKYEAYLRAFAELYKDDFNKYAALGQRIVLGQDNEPLNQNYHGTDSLENYFALAKVFNKVFHEYGWQTADGCSFVETIYALLTGYNTRDATLAFKVYRQNKYIELMKTAGFDLSNIHWGINDDIVTDGEAKIATDYLVTQLGIPTCSNEYHYYMATAAAGTVTKVVNEWKKTKCQFVIVWSGDHKEGVIIDKKDGSFNGSPADQLATELGILTPLGMQYRDAIK